MELKLIFSGYFTNFNNRHNEHLNNAMYHINIKNYCITINSYL